MNKIATSGKRILKGDVWHDDRGEIAGYPDQWDPPMTEEERHLAALSDPDNPPMTAERLARLRQVSRARFVRQKLGLSAAEFSARFGIPLEMLNDWERHRAEPDAAALAYLAVIAHAPEAVEQALARGRRRGARDPSRPFHGAFSRRQEFLRKRPCRKATANRSTHDTF